jgi:putative zinc finger/helix-turn-helix YgiT family protein
MGRSSSKGKVEDRPFPWVCPNCLEVSVRPIAKQYTARVKHDGLQYSLDIPNLEIPTCEKCGEELFTNAVDERVNQALRVRLCLLSPTQIRASRKALGLKQSEMGRRLKIAPATISRWETGALIQSGAMDNYLRVFFEFTAVQSALSGSSQNPCLGLGLVSQHFPVGADTSRPTGHEASCRERANRFPCAIGIYGADAIQEFSNQVAVLGFFNLGS